MPVVFLIFFIFIFIVRVELQVKHAEISATGQDGPRRVSVPVARNQNTSECLEIPKVEILENVEGGPVKAVT